MSVSFRTSRPVTHDDIVRVNSAILEDKDLPGAKPLIDLEVHPLAVYTTYLKCGKNVLCVLDYDPKTKSFSTLDWHTHVNDPTELINLFEKYSDIKIISEHQEEHNARS